MKFAFKNSFGEKISCELQKNGSKILVVMAHGFKGNKNHPLIKNIEAELKKIGIDSLRFDFSGCGESEGDYSKSTIKKQSDEIIDAIKKLKYEKTILVGGSMGGAASLIAARKSKLIKGLVLISPLVFPSITFKDSLIKYSPYVMLNKVDPEKIKLLDKFQLIKKGKKKIKSFIKEEVMGKEMIEEIKKLDLIKVAEKINLPTLIIHGKFDELIPLSHAEYLNKIMPKSELISANCFHMFWIKKQINEVSIHALKFIKNLKEKFIK